MLGVGQQMTDNLDLRAGQQRIAVGRRLDHEDPVAPLPLRLARQVRPIAQRLHVLDVGDARDLRDGILQQTRRGIDLVEYPRECRQSLLVAQGFLGIDQTRLARKRASRPFCRPPV